VSRPPGPGSALLVWRSRNQLVRSSVLALSDSVARSDCLVLAYNVAHPSPMVLSRLMVHSIDVALLCCMVHSLPLALSRVTGSLTVFGRSRPLWFTPTSWCPHLAWLAPIRWRSQARWLTHSVGYSLLRLVHSCRLALSHSLVHSPIVVLFDGMVRSRPNGARIQRGSLALRGALMAGWFTPTPRHSRIPWLTHSTWHTPRVWFTLFNWRSLFLWFTHIVWCPRLWWFTHHCWCPLRDRFTRI
jgi:hypothetical protein